MDDTLRARMDERGWAWRQAPPDRLLGRGHPAGDFLEAYDWVVLEERSGYLKVEATLPEQVRNLRGGLFGGFTPTYVDFVSLFTVHAGERRDAPFSYWLATTSMRVDYLEPVKGPRFILESSLVKERNRMCFVETRFLDMEGELLVFALTTLRKIPREDLADD